MVNSSKESVQKLLEIRNKIYLLKIGCELVNDLSGAASYRDIEKQLSELIDECSGSKPKGKGQNWLQRLLCGSF